MLLVSLPRSANWLTIWISRRSGAFEVEFEQDVTLHLRVADQSRSQGAQLRIVSQMRLANDAKLTARATAIGDGTMQDVPPISLEVMPFR